MNDPKPGDGRFVLGDGGELTKDFKMANPPELKHVMGDPRKLDQLRQVEKWASAERARFGKTVAQMRSTWVAQEADRIWQERSKNTFDLRPPHMQGAILPEARHRVQLQIRAHYQNIDEVRRRQRAVITGRPLNEIAPRQDLVGP